MIMDSIDQIGKYLPKSAKTAVLDWLKTINLESEPGYYEIAGETIYARILSYQTKKPDECIIEAHNQYIDIQSTLVGEEGIQVYCRENLEESKEYDEDKDVIFLKHSEEPYARINVKEGYFAMLFPNEAHQPKISFNDSCPVIKKFVIKIRRDLFE